MPRLPSLPRPSKNQAILATVLLAIGWLMLYRQAPQQTLAVTEWIFHAVYVVIKAIVITIVWIFRFFANASQFQLIAVGFVLLVIGMAVLFRDAVGSGFGWLFDLIGLTDLFSGRLDWVTPRRVIGFIIAVSALYVMYNYLFVENTPISKNAFGASFVVFGIIVWFTLQNGKYRSMVGANQSRYDFSGEEE